MPPRSDVDLDNQHRSPRECATLVSRPHAVALRMLIRQVIYYRRKLNVRRLGAAREFSCGSGLGSCDPGPGLRGAAFASCGSVFASCGPAFASRGAALGQIIAEGRTRAPGRHIRDLVRCRAPGENCEEYAAPEECGMSIRPAPPRPAAVNVCNPTGAVRLLANRPRPHTNAR